MLRNDFKRLILSFHTGWAGSALAEASGDGIPHRCLNPGKTGVIGPR